MTRYVPYRWVDRHVRGAARMGLPLQGLFDVALIDEGQRGPDGQISAAQWLLLCMTTTRMLDDAAHGLATSSIASSYAPLGLRLALGSATLGESLKALCQFYRSISPAIELRVETGQATATVAISVKSDLSDDGLQLEETYLIWIFMHCLYYLNGKFPLLRVSTRDPDHFNLGGNHFGLGGPVELGEATSFTFSRHLLLRGGSARAGANVYWECEKLWLDFIDGHARGTPPGDLQPRQSLTALAKTNGVSTTTMRRRIRGEHGGFREMRRSAIVDAANRMLRCETLSVEAIASEIGYQDARAFRRFFVGATGLTPSEMRLRLQSSRAEQDMKVRRTLEDLGAALAS